MLRVIPGVGVPQAVAYAMKAQGATNAIVGNLQTIFFAGIGVGSLVAAFRVRAGTERAGALVWLPLGMVAALGVCPLLPGRFWLVPVGISGLLLGGVTPILVGYGQSAACPMASGWPARSRWGSRGESAAWLSRA